jgi:aminopeptidase
MNDKHLDRYAEILVMHGAGLRAGQDLFLSADVAHRDLALRVGEAAYDRGAGAVHYWLNDPLQHAQTIRRGRLEQVEAARAHERQWFDEIVRQRSALISLRGDEYPGLQQRLGNEHPAAHAAFVKSSLNVTVLFHNHGINRSLCPWVVAGAATPSWAQRVFPELPTEEAVDRLWEQIFRFTFADCEDAVERAGARDRLLHKRRRELNALGIREVHVFGEGTDLWVGLSDRHRWLGGSKETANGQTFNANVPSEENFTTPDRRLTRGHVRATMPFNIKNGGLVEDVAMNFEDGRLVDFEAGRGKELFARWIDSDEGARYLGEFALVGQDSAIAQSGLFFEHTLYDANAWSHLALGRANATALEGGDAMTAAELAEVGSNTSAIHTDIMFGSLEVTILATKSDEGEVVLIENGEWAERFR